MKVCERCGAEIGTRDGENRCRKCENKKIKAAEARARRLARDAAMQSIGLTKVRGALGGTYWE